MIIQFSIFSPLKIVRQQRFRASSGRPQVTRVQPGKRNGGARHADRFRRLLAAAAVAAATAIATIAATTAAAAAVGERGESADVADLAAAQSTRAHRKDNHHDERSAGLSPWLWHLREGWQGRR